MSVVVIVPETRRYGNVTEIILGGNVLLDNERTDVRDDYAHLSVKSQFWIPDNTCSAPDGRDRAMI